MTLPISETDRRSAMELIGEERLRSFINPKQYVAAGVEYMFRNEKTDK